MKDIKTMIASYEESCDLLSERILQLSRQISAVESGTQEKMLQSRRRLLCTELYEMRGTIHELREYVR